MLTENYERLLKDQREVHSNRLNEVETQMESFSRQSLGEYNRNIERAYDGQSLYSKRSAATKQRPMTTRNAQLGNMSKPLMNRKLDLDDMSSKFERMRLQKPQTQQRPQMPKLPAFEPDFSPEEQEFYGVKRARDKP